MYPEGDLAWKSKAPNQQGVEYLVWGIGTSQGGWEHCRGRVWDRVSVSWD